MGGQGRWRCRQLMQGGMHDNSCVAGSRRTGRGVTRSRGNRFKWDNERFIILPRSDHEIAGCDRSYMLWRSLCRWGILSSLARLTASLCGVSQRSRAPHYRGRCLDVTAPASLALMVWYPDGMRRRQPRHSCSRKFQNFDSPLGLLAPQHLIRDVVLLHFLMFWDAWSGPCGIFLGCVMWVLMLWHPFRMRRYVEYGRSGRSGTHSGCVLRANTSLGVRPRFEPPASVTIRLNSPHHEAIEANGIYTHPEGRFRQRSMGKGA